jgi:uncharacterized protein (TIGR00369 family)
MSEPEVIDAAAVLNEHRDGWCTAMGLRFVRATVDEVVAEWTLGPEHLQAYGIVHGGVHSGVIETLASVGAAMHAMSLGKNVVGLENHTSFLRAVREGTLRATAVPVFKGRSSQVWEAKVESSDGKLIATGRVRLAATDPSTPLGGATATPPPAIGPNRRE